MKQDRGTTTLACLVFLVCAACSPDKRAWNRAQEAASLQAYRSYLGEHPQGAFVGQAKARIEELEFAQAERENSAEAFERFLASHAAGRLAETARSRLATLCHRRATSAGTIEALEDCPARFPGSPHAEALRAEKARLEASVWRVRLLEAPRPAKSFPLVEYRQGMFGPVPHTWRAKPPDGSRLLVLSVEVVASKRVAVAASDVQLLDGETGAWPLKALGSSEPEGDSPYLRPEGNWEAFDARGEWVLKMTSRPTPSIRFAKGPHRHRLVFYVPENAQVRRFRWETHTIGIPEGVIPEKP